MPWREMALPEGTEDLARRVRRGAMAVHREVGPGFRESTYQRCLAYVLRESGHAVLEQIPMNVRFRGLTIPRAGEADMLVDGTIVVELKAREQLHRSHVAQTLSYVRSLDVPLGLVFNFHAPLLLKQ